MPRNFAWVILRGPKSGIPTLNPGEFYFAEDEKQVYIGTSSGNSRVLLQNVIVPPAVFAGVTAPTSAPGGPTNPRRVVAFAQLIDNGISYWVPLMR